MTTPYFSMQHADVVEAAEKLEAECDRLKEHIKFLAEWVETAKAEAAKAEAERDRYRTALKRYGRHDLKCATQVRFTKPDACDCGLYEAFR